MEKLRIGSKVKLTCKANLSWPTVNTNIGVEPCGTPWEDCYCIIDDVEDTVFGNFKYKILIYTDETYTKLHLAHIFPEEVNKNHVVLLESCVEDDRLELQSEIDRLKIKCNQYAKRLVREGFDDVEWEATPNSTFAGAFK